MLVMEDQKTVIDGVTKNVDSEIVQCSDGGMVRHICILTEFTH